MKEIYARSLAASALGRKALYLTKNYANLQECIDREADPETLKIRGPRLAFEPGLFWHTFPSAIL